jgi:DNA-binding NarL/FixJ family response regulator
MDEARQAAQALASMSLASYPAGLTEREVEVLRLVAEGLTDQAIADQLVVSPRTVHAHLRSIYGKLEVSTRTAAAREAARLNLI